MTVGRGRQWLEMVFSYQRVAGSGKSYELRRVARAARGGGDSRDRRSRFVANRGFRPAPAGLSEQMPVFECRAAPEPADGGRLAPPLVGARGVSAGRPARHREILAELWAEPVAMLRIAGLCGAAGHSNRGFAQPQGGGRKAEFSLSVIRKWAQVEKLRPVGSLGPAAAPRLVPPLVGARGGSAGRLTRCRSSPIPGGNATENRQHGYR